MRRAGSGRVGGFVAARIAAWRTGSASSQRWPLGVLAVGVLLSLTVSLIDYQWMPVTGYFIWLMLGMLVLRFAALLALCGLTLAAAGTAMLAGGPITEARVVAYASLVVAVGLLIFQSSLQRSGLPGWRGEAMLAELRDRLQAQGRIPPLPTGWSCQSAMRAADGASYAGDFLVAELDEDGTRLEMILVDVCGKGVGAATQALQFSGALGGLIGALPPQALMEAANDYLIRQFPDESFATAVHVVIDLTDGGYTITSGGHPPALRWCGRTGTWEIDNARGTALGITRRPELHASSGRLAPGEAVMFYTDGVVESRSAGIDEGIEWLRETAREAVAGGFAGAPERIIRQVPRGDDDRALLILARD